MTSIITRSPLQHMPMNRAAHISSGPGSTRRKDVDTQQQQQQSRRRSARHLDEYEEDHAPAAKRLKGDGAGVPGGGRTNGDGASTRKGKKTYEEADDDFAFSRAKTRKTATVQRDQRDVVPPPYQEPSEPAVGETERRPRRTLPVSPKVDGGHDGVQPRRSKRLSGDQVGRRPTEMEDPFTSDGLRGTKADTTVAPRRRDGSPALGNGGAGTLHVPKKRGTKIDLILSETPVIRRNKAMRQTSGDGQGQRRSSAGLRGRRASSLIDAGSSSAVPHAEVGERDFHKHIGQDMMEPRRMKQLLVWCARRAMAPAGSGLAPQEGGAGLDSVEAAVRSIQEGLLSDFASRNDLSNWFDRQDDTPSRPQDRHQSPAGKPNPRNVQNATKLAELEAELERLESERKAWDELMTHGPAARRAEVPRSGSADTTTAGVGAARATTQVLDPATIDAALLAPSQAEILHALLAPSRGEFSAAAQVRARLDRAADGLEFKVDLYRDSVHRLDRYVDTAARVADRLLAGVAGRLEEAGRERMRGSGAGERGGGGDGGVAGVVAEGDALRALGRVLHRRGNGEQ